MDAASLLQRLVAIESVNPSLDAQGAGEASIAAFIADWAQSQGLSAEMIGTPERPSVLVRGGRGQTGRRLVFGAHLDTVGLAGSVDGITPASRRSKTTSPSSWTPSRQPTLGSRSRPRRCSTGPRWRPPATLKSWLP